MILKQAIQFAPQALQVYLLFAFNFLMDLEKQDSLIKTLEDQFTCPIYKVPIQNPVITPVGITYERQALEEWLDVNGVEPQSKKPLDKNNLIQNLALKGLASKIYKEVPKLERSLTEKDEIIANLTEEVAQLKKALQSEKEKNQENEELMECTLEKTKKIRKIHERTNNENEIEMKKLKEKVNEMSKLRMQLKQTIARQKILCGEAELHKSEINRLNAELRKERGEVKTLTSSLKKIVDQRRISVKGYKQLEQEAYSNYKSEFWHRQHIIESVFNNIEKIASEFTNKSHSLGRLKQIINSGVDEILNRREENLVEGMDSERQISSTRELCRALKNRISIQRYILDLQHQEDQDDPLNYHYRLSKIANTVGYEIDFLPFSQPPTQIELQLDWPKVIEIDCQFTEEKWQLFISQIGKFPNLTKLKTLAFTVKNLTSAQLSSIPNLRRMEIGGWTTIDQNQRNQIRTFAATHPEVKILIQRNNQDPSDFDFGEVFNAEDSWQFPQIQP